MGKLHVNVNARQRDLPLLSSLRAAPADAGRVPFHASLHPTQNAGGVSLDGTVRLDYQRRRHHGGLSAERNGGVMLSAGGDRIAYELADVAPITKVRAL